MLSAALLALAPIAQGPAVEQTPATPPAPAAPAHRSRGLRFPDGTIAYIPASASPNPPLLVLLHGAGHRELELVRHFAAEADARGIVLLAPSAHGVTWDTVAIAEEPPSRYSALANSMAMRFSSSRDAERVEADIAALAKFVPVDRSKTVLAGFSDGATFALALGMSRAHDFAAVIAWSPGIAIRAANPAKGRRVLVSHGRQDPLLRYDITCGEIVPLVQSEGGLVSFVPFQGVHEVPESVEDATLDAVFGPVPGSAPHPLPAKVEKCMRKPDDPADEIMR
jgi:phospholipase/carboxylesterase